MRSRSGILFALGSLSWAAAQWFLVWLIARTAGGAEAVGQYSYVLAIATPLFILGQFGLRTVYLSLRANARWRSYVVIRSIGITVALLLLVGYFTVADVVEPMLWLAVAALKCADAYVDLLFARLQRENLLAEIGVLSLLKSAGTVVVSTLVIVVLQEVAAAVLGAALVSAVAALAVKLASSRLLRDRHGDAAGDRHGDEHDSRRPGYREILRAAIPTTISEGIAALSAYLPVLFLSVIGEVAAAGVFAAAAYVLTLANLVGAILKNTVITSFRITLLESGPRRLTQRSHRYAVGLGMVGVALSPLIVFAGGPVLRLLYGAEFGMNHLQLALLALAFVPIAPSYIYSASLNVLNVFRGQAWTWLFACAVGLAAGLLALASTPDPIIAALFVAAGSAWARFAGVWLLSLRGARLSE